MERNPVIKFFKRFTKRPRSAAMRAAIRFFDSRNNPSRRTPEPPTVTNACAAAPAPSPSPALPESGPQPPPVPHTQSETPLADVASQVFSDSESDGDACYDCRSEASSSMRMASPLQPRDGAPTASHQPTCRSRGFTGSSLGGMSVEFLDVPCPEGEEGPATPPAPPVHNTHANAAPRTHDHRVIRPAPVQGTLPPHNGSMQRTAVQTKEGMEGMAAGAAASSPHDQHNPFAAAVPAGGDAQDATHPRSECGGEDSPGHTNAHLTVQAKLDSNNSDSQLESLQSPAQHDGFVMLTLNTADVDDEAKQQVPIAAPPPSTSSAASHGSHDSTGSWVVLGDDF